MIISEFKTLCKSDKYIHSRKCQKKHWKYHKADCMDMKLGRKRHKEIRKQKADDSSEREGSTGILSKKA